MTTHTSATSRWRHLARTRIALETLPVTLLLLAFVLVAALSSGASWRLVLLWVGAVLVVGLLFGIRPRAPRVDVPALPDARRQDAAQLMRVLFGQGTSFEIDTDLDGPFRIVVRDLDDGQCIREDQRAWISKTVDITVPGRWQALWWADCRGVTFERTQEPTR